MNPAIFCCVIVTAATYLLVYPDHQTKSTPQDVIKKYERYVLEMRADSVIQLFTDDAEIGHEGQPSIKGKRFDLSLPGFIRKSKGHPESGQCLKCFHQG